MGLIRNVQSKGGRIYVTVLRKPRLLTEKIARALQSVGTPAYFLDPIDVNHGESGQVIEGDVVTAIFQGDAKRELLDGIRTIKHK